MGRYSPGEALNSPFVFIKGSIDLEIIRWWAATPARSMLRFAFGCSDGAQQTLLFFCAPYPFHDVLQLLSARAM